MLEDVEAVLLLWMFSILYIDSVPSSVVSGTPYCRWIVTWRCGHWRSPRQRKRMCGNGAERTCWSDCGAISTWLDKKLWHCYIGVLIVAVHTTTTILRVAVTPLYVDVNKFIIIKEPDSRLSDNGTSINSKAIKTEQEKTPLPSNVPLLRNYWAYKWCSSQMQCHKCNATMLLHLSQC